MLLPNSSVFPCRVVYSLLQMITWKVNQNNAIVYFLLWSSYLCQCRMLYVEKPRFFSKCNYLAPMFSVFESNRKRTCRCWPLRCTQLTWHSLILVGFHSWWDACKKKECSVLNKLCLLFVCVLEMSRKALWSPSGQKAELEFSVQRSFGIIVNVF